MPKEPKESAAPLWSKLKPHLADLPSAELLRPLKDLYGLSPANRRFVASRVGGQPSASLEAYQREISTAINPDHLSPIDLRRARKALSDYRKATPEDLDGCLALMVHYIEQGTAQTLSYGDIGESFFDSLCSVLGRISEEAAGASHEAHANAAVRIRELAKQASFIGWGFGDFLVDTAAHLEKQVRQRGGELPAARPVP